MGARVWTIVAASIFVSSARADSSDPPAVNSEYTSTLYSDAEIRLKSHTVSANIEDEYLPRILQEQKNSAGFNINPEALKALAVADRSLLYYSLKAKGSIGSGGDAPVYDPSLVAQQSVDQAASDTVRELIQLKGQPVLGYAVDGARPAGGTPFGVANLSLDPDPTGTERYVTYNNGRSGSKILTTKLGSKSNPLNRGALSIQGADFLADHGWNYLDILHFYYGDDVQLTLGTSLYPQLSLDGKTQLSNLPYVPTLTQMPLDNFENNAGLLQSAGARNRSDQYVLFDANTNAMRSTKIPHSGRASELLNIDYDAAHAKGQPFTYRILTGTSGDEGSDLGNLRLPAPGGVGFYLRTKTTGLTTQIALNDIDGTEQSVAKKVIADGKWHKYSWDLTTTANWNPLQHGDNVITGPFTLNSITLHGQSSASVRMDDVFYTQSGSYYSGGGVGVVTGGGTVSLGGAINKSAYWRIVRDIEYGRLEHLHGRRGIHQQWCRNVDGY